MVQLAFGERLNAHGRTVFGLVREGDSSPVGERPLIPLLMSVFFGIQAVLAVSSLAYGLHAVGVGVAPGWREPAVGGLPYCRKAMIINQLTPNEAHSMQRGARRQYNVLLHRPVVREQ